MKSTLPPKHDRRTMPVSADMRSQISNFEARERELMRVKCKRMFGGHDAGVAGFLGLLVGGIAVFLGLKRQKNLDT